MQELLIQLKMEISDLIVGLNLLKMMCHTNTESYIVMKLETMAYQ
jgi:hypothetical protein